MRTVVVKGASSCLAPYCLLFLTLQCWVFSVQAAPSPYSWDANTLFLFHFDEAAGASAATNAGSLEGNAYGVNMTSASSTPPAVTTILGAAGYPGFASSADLNSSG